MTQKDVRRMGRSELIEIIQLQEKENDELRAKIDTLRNELEDQRIVVAPSGSLEEAGAKLSQVFRDAEASVEQYKESLRQMGLSQDAAWEAELLQVKKRAAQLLRAAQEQARATLEEAEAEKARARRESQEYWEEISRRLSAYVSAQQGLKDMLSGEPWQAER